MEEGRGKNGKRKLTKVRRSRGTAREEDEVGNSVTQGKKGWMHQ